MEIIKVIGSGPESVYVYYFPSDYSPPSWPCKIGRSKGDPLVRIRAQQASMKERPLIPLVIKTDDSILLEAELHCSLTRCDAFGKEWFMTNPDEVERAYNGETSQEITLGLLIRTKRAQLGLTQSELAKIVGTRQATVSAIENNPSSVGVRTAIQILDGLGCELSIQPKKIPD
jgi:HTH-type transcriptional regulator/antitoxin HipB